MHRANTWWYSHVIPLFYLTPIIFNCVCAHMCMQKSFSVATSNSDNCSMCGGEKFFFEPATLYCNQCSTRLKPSALYFSNR